MSVALANTEFPTATAASCILAQTPVARAYGWGIATRDFGTSSGPTSRFSPVVYGAAAVKMPGSPNLPRHQVVRFFVDPIVSAVPLR